MPRCAGVEDSLELDARFAGPHQLFHPGPLIVDEIVLDVKAQTRQLDPIDDTVRSLLDDAGLAALEPFGHAQALAVQQLALQFRQQRPAKSACRVFAQV